MVVRRLRSPIVKSTQDREEEVESFSQFFFTYLVGDPSDLLDVVHKSSLNFRDKNLNFRDKISSSLLRINLSRNKRFGN